MRLLVLGAGGIGGYFGGRLADAGADVTFLVREPRAKKLADGLEIRGPSGDATVKVKTLTKVDAPFDLVVLSCKAYDLDGAIDAVRPAVGAQTTILPLLNGLSHLDRLDDAFGGDKTVGGLAHISVTLDADGTIRQLNKLQSLTYGARDDSQASRCDRIANVFEGASFDVRRSDKVIQEMWEKFAFITAAGAIGCLARACTGDIVATRDGERLVLQMLDECQAVASAFGFAVRDKARNWARGFLTEAKSNFKPSMLMDLERGSRIEADHLVGDMIRRGAEYGATTDLLKIAYCQLQAYQHRQRAA